MAYISRPPRVKYTRSCKAKDMSESKRIRQQHYSTNRWHKLRHMKLYANPLCEVCERNDRITPATSAHHIISPFDDGICDVTLMYDFDNLMSICHECHGNLHSPSQYKGAEEL